jgi:hypothetical protein
MMPMIPKLVAAIPVAALVVAACVNGAAQEEGADPGPGPEETRIVAAVDLSKHTVPLEDIHFDTFDGGSIPLSEISGERMLSLLDAIPPLDEPEYDDPAGASWVPAQDGSETVTWVQDADARGGDWLKDDDLIIGYVGEEGSAFAYPLKILNFHEIVNDEIDGVPVLVTYCPLCRSGVVYDRRLDGRLLTFGNTSALYESDLVMVDWQTNSYWWQTAGEAIVGTLSGKSLKPLPAATMTWGEWKAVHGGTEVLSRNTGFPRSYERDPFSNYGSLIDRGQFAFPVSDASLDDRLAAADEVLGVTVGEASKAYPLRKLGDAAVNDHVGGQRIVVFSSQEGPSANAFRADANGRALTFRYRGGRYVDHETESDWDLSGRATSGPLQGEQLHQLPSRYAFWFAFIAAIPDTELYEE